MSVLKLPTLLIPLVRRLLLIEQTCNLRIFATSIYLKLGVRDNVRTNVFLRLVLATIVAVEKQHVLNFVSLCV